MIEMHYHSAGPMRGHLHIDVSHGQIALGHFRNFLIFSLNNCS